MEYGPVTRAVFLRLLGQVFQSSVKFLDLGVTWRQRRSPLRGPPQSSGRWGQGEEDRVCTSPTPAGGFPDLLRPLRGLPWRSWAPQG